MRGLRRRRGASPTGGPAVKPEELKPDLRAVVEDWVRKRYGRLGILFLAAVTTLGLLWWQWDEIKAKPGISAIIDWLEERPVPQAAPGKFAVAVAHLDNDPNGDTERLIVEAIEEFPGVQVLRFDRRIALDQDARDEALRQAHENARSLLTGSGADVLIWGTVLKADGKSLPKLHWTTAAEVGLQRYSGRYQTTEDLNLPPLFWDDLVEVLRLVVARHGEEFAASQGQFIADRLRPFIDRVQTLLAHARWSREAWAEVSNALGNALVTVGGEAGDNQALGEAIVVFQAVLAEHTRERAPLDWAATQNNLGVALSSLGEREAGTERLEEAVAAFRAALEEYTREHTPLDWARIQNNLGGALSSLGERGLGTKRLEEAVDAYRAALEEYTRERAPFDWAATHNDLGLTLSRLGEREAGPELHEEAVMALRAALEEVTRERVPLDWAMTQNNLGVALMRLGKREAGPELLEEAGAAFRAALEEYTRERAPLDRAKTQNNLGVALLSLGEREAGTERLEEAAATFRAAFEILRSTRAGYYRRMVGDNLHRALSALEVQRRAKP